MFPDFVRVLNLINVPDLNRDLTEFQTQQLCYISNAGSFVRKWEIGDRFMASGDAKANNTIEGNPDFLWLIGITP